jgi:hypothetical protein
MGPLWLVLRTLFFFLGYSECLKSTWPLGKCLGFCCPLDFPFECARELVTKFALDVLVPFLLTDFGTLIALTLVDLDTEVIGVLFFKDLGSEDE